MRNDQEMLYKHLLRAFPNNYFVCLPGVRRVGDGSHTLLFCLWEGEHVHSCVHVEEEEGFNSVVFPVLVPFL